MIAMYNNNIQQCLRMESKISDLSLLSKTSVIVTSCHLAPTVECRAGKTFLCGFSYKREGKTKIRNKIFRIDATASTARLM